MDLMDYTMQHDSLRCDIVHQFTVDDHFMKMSIKMDCHEVSILLPNHQATYTYAKIKQTWHNVNKG